MPQIKETTKKMLQGTGVLSSYFNLRQWIFFTYTVDACVVSPPKAGRTWMRMMLAHVFHYLYDTGIQIDVHKIAEEDARVPYIYFTHDTADLHKNTQKNKTVNDTKFWKYNNAPIIFLARDPRDMAVSYYHHLADRNEGLYEGDMSEFLRDDEFGIHETVTFMNNWYEYLEDRGDAMLTSYEEMQKDTQRELRRICDFVGVETADEVIQKAVQATKFDRMKKMEKQEVLDDGRLQPKDTEDTNTYKTRKGKVGGFREELEDADIQYVNEALQNLHSGFGYSANT